MSTNNMILNHFFTQSVFNNMVYSDDVSLFKTIIRLYVKEPKNKDNRTLISEIYDYMSNEYRNEYFYQNTLLNKLLVGKHSVNTTTALTQIPIEKSKADFILINGKAVVYEIKTALDTFERLNTQIENYYKAFNHVCVVTSENQFEQACEKLKHTSVGVYTLTEQETLSKKKRKEPVPDNSRLNHVSIFKILHKVEFENIILRYYGKLPKCSQVFHYDECLKMFQAIPIMNAYEMALAELKNRNKIECSEFEKIPYSLKSLVYFSRPSSNKEWNSINEFLLSRIKEVN